MRGGRATEPESKAPELYRKEGLHMSKSVEGGDSVFTADQKHLDTSGDVSKRVCVCARTSTCGSACSHVWLTFSLAQFHWVRGANRRWRLRRQTNYQQVISSSPTRSIRVFAQVCQSVCLLEVVALMFSDQPLINMIVSTRERKITSFLFLLVSPLLLFGRE